MQLSPGYPLSYKNTDFFALKTEVSRDAGERVAVSLRFYACGNQPCKNIIVLPALLKDNLT